MVNFSLAREIYGMQPWYVDQETLPALLAILDNTTALENPETKYNTPSLVVLNETRVIDRPYGSSWFPGQLDNNDKFTGVGVIKLDGPITVSGGASSLGMEQLSNLMLKMAADERIVYFMVLANSGGGSAAAVQIMADTIKKVDATKPVYGLIKKGGMAASACYGIMSACREIYSEAPMNMVGSAGTMIQFEGREANTQDPNGKKHIRLYASKSTRKNEEFEAALNNDNYELIIDNLLNPMNEVFLNLIEGNRPVLKGTDFDTGKCIFSKDAVGTFIDGIKSFDEVLAIAENPQANKNTPASSGNHSINNNVMTIQKLKQDHPDVYAAAFGEGVSAEKLRVKNWLVYADADPDTVKSGILGEETVDASREELMVKMYKSDHLKNLERDSAGDINNPPSGGAPDATDEEKEVAAFSAEVDKLLK